MDLQAILNSVLRSSGVSAETAYADSDDDAILRLVDLANQSVSTLSQYPWQQLIKTHTFTLSTDTTYTLPTDYGRMQADTFYTENRFYPVDMPTSPTAWGYLQATTGGNGIQIRARMMGDKIHIYQPESGAVLRFEYISKHPVLDVDGVTTKQYFDADTDTLILDDMLVLYDIKWRYRELVGLDWQVAQTDFYRYQKTLRGQHGGAKRITPSEARASTPYYDQWRPVPNDP